MLRKISFLILFFTIWGSLGQECPRIGFPVDGATEVAVDVTITWPEVTGMSINGYLISLGTTPGGTDIIDRTATGINTEFKPPLGLPENTVIYATISVLLFNATPMECESSTFTTMDVTTPPPCTFLVAPDDNASDVTVVTDIIWNYSPSATSYTLTIGTSQGGSDILDAVNVGNVLSYDPPQDLPQDIRVYVTVRPENENGYMSACTEESFYTGALDDPCTNKDEITGEMEFLGPTIDLPSRFVICSNDGSINLSSDVQADGIRWLSNENGVETLLSENRNFQITEVGNYALEAYNYIVHSGITIECTSFKSFNVVSSEIATIESVDIKSLAAGKQATVIATGIGEYEYAIDDINGPYQDDPTFYNISEGPHFVYVRDKNGCGIASQLIERGLKTEDFPKFFTPNGDGINDFWQFVTPKEVAKSSELLEGKISIFDRYGSLLLHLDPESKGWDGRFQGIELPSSDYWFKAVSLNQQEITGHFTLKR